jgi:hypothetical protein
MNTNPDDDIDPDTDYVIGLSPKMRERNSAKHICSLIEKTITGDPGDSDDLDSIMLSVSSLLDETPSIRVYNQEDSPPVVSMFRPKDLRLLLVHEDEIEDPQVQTIIRHFGFDGTTLRPIE